MRPLGRSSHELHTNVNSRSNVQRIRAAKRCARAIDGLFDGQGAWTRQQVRAWRTPPRCCSDGSTWRRDCGCSPVRHALRSRTRERRACLHVRHEHSDASRRIGKQCETRGMRADRAIDRDETRSVRGLVPSGEVPHQSVPVGDEPRCVPRHEAKRRETRRRDRRADDVRAQKRKTSH